ncbi:dihydrodipicolinate synthase family protein [Streptomyces sp. NPDC047000]|uniref:dihydrodipicolinate synthase family protein n=1 Tax=Streptomyces sp. NPDC047000 TaxID=3155474 RepID=UPI00340EE117
MARKPWHGINVATALPFNDDLSVDFDGFADHVRWLADNGMDGVCPNGSLGEYQTLTPEERARVVEVAVEAAPDGFNVMAGAAAYGSQEACRWIEQAGQAGARSVLLLPPNAYRADRRTVVEHYRAAAAVGLPIVAYNNPIDTKVDLLPDLLAELHGEGLIVAVKEFSGDVRRAYEVRELAPELDVLVGSDDVLLEIGLAGAVGWIAGYTNAFPNACKKAYDLATSGRPEDAVEALALYRDLHPLLRWDSKTEFVQAIKLSMDLVGRKGGACRPPRLPLPPETAERITAQTHAVISKGLN